MDANAQYGYFDGSGNGYTITRDSLKYNPITPERSSSGTYSGGEPKTLAISIKEYDLLRDLFEKAIARSEAHQNDREMMTGMIVKDAPGGGSTRVILKKDSREKKDIEAKLGEFIVK